ncbi:DNA phosphorothioation-associated DGQHR protein 1 [Celeribacter neptunius]|uniref:DNA phosphorothioation-associated DGQHR protein 1 n=1 Tax=Celeribacter neptunius TaxID=588602 RepID=A0A1I3XUS9_9RHOB|nr:DNA phosphorothioation-associated DGQHR protein 1 [Celeribacter neptunius]SFK23252.1 DNA phosphorothioation-associated DGQHR protein 1 [Celeribacter neptunius]
MNMEQDSADFARFPAIRVEQPLGEFYAVAIPARTLLKVCYTDRLRAVIDGDSYRLDGSQRDIDHKRIKEIGRYIGTSEVAFPNSVILAANYAMADGLSVSDSSKKWRVEMESEESGCCQLIIPSSEPLAPIIDGQHRLFGFTEAAERRLGMPILCSVFLDLPRPYQAYLFATINSTQKPVDRSQTYELFGYNIDEEPPEFWSPEKLAVFLSRKLNTDPSSPLYRRILVAAENDFAITRAEAKADNRWMISTATVVDGITRLISTSPKRDADELRTGRENKRSKLGSSTHVDRSPLRSIYLETRDKVLLGAVSNFFKAVLKAYGTELGINSYLTKTVGMQALFDTLRALSPLALNDMDFSEDWFLERLMPIAAIDFSHEAFQQASGQGRTQIRRVLFFLLKLEQNLTDVQTEEVEKIIDQARRTL